MSALNFQKAMAHLIRFPKATLDDTLKTFESLELDEAEFSRLRKMEVDPLVRKFGFKMSFCRQRDAVQVMTLSKSFLPQDLLDRMFITRFEPTRVSTDFVMLGVQFIDFILTDPTCLKWLQEHPSYVLDLLRYDHAKAYVIRQGIRKEASGLSEHSKLRHKAFLIINVDHDIPSFSIAVTKDPSYSVAPSQKSMKLVFVASEQPPFYRMFQIDDLIERFLLLQRERPEAWKAPLPDAYPVMVKIGLCK